MNKEIITIAETHLPNVNNFKNDMVKISILKGNYDINPAVLPIESSMYIITYRKNTDHLNNLFWEFVSFKE
ncbi:MAG: hypothetical protein KGZ87_08905 [Bacteroidetes bacterium]|nr:hypothetical protein [Bacteroidota bacterium]